MTYTIDDLPERYQAQAREKLAAVPQMPLRIVGGAAPEPLTLTPPVDVQAITLPFPPTANHFKAAIVVKGRARMILTKQAREYKAKVDEILWQAGLMPSSGPISVSVSVFRPRRVGDLDNSLKVVIDCLKGAAFYDDDQIVRLHALRFDDKDNPRVEVSWRPCAEPLAGLAGYLSQSVEQGE